MFTGSPLYANRVMLDYTGLSPDQVPLVGFGGRLSHPEDVEKFRAIRRESLDRGNPFQLELRMRGKDGEFRQDLFYRLNMFPIEMPSLRDRMDDIPLLVEYFIERYGKTAGKKFRNINKKTLRLFQAYDWPGNIRELQNVIERAVVLCDSEIFSVDETWLKREGAKRPRATLPFVANIVEQEKEMIRAALVASRGGIAGPAGATAKLGIPRQTLESKIKSLGIDKHRFKAGPAH